MKNKSNSRVLVEVVGGLGNQLFCYAAGAYLAKKAGTKLVLDISKVGVGAVDQLRHGAERRMLADYQHVVDAGDVGDRRQVGVDIDRQLLARHDGCHAERGHGGEPDGAAVRRRIRYRFVGDEPAGAGLGIDDHLLADLRRERVGQDTAEKVGGAARRETAHQLDVASDLLRQRRQTRHHPERRGGSGVHERSTLHFISSLIAISLP